MKRALLFIIMLCGLALLVPAGDVVCRKAGVSVWFPDNWNVHLMRDGSIVAFPGDGDIFCRVDLVDAISKTPQILSYDYSSINYQKYGQSEPVADPGGRNGLPHKYWQIQGVRGNNVWDITVDYYKVPAGTVVFTYGMLFGADPKYRPIQDQLLRMGMSVKLVNTRGQNDGW